MSPHLFRLGHQAPQDKSEGGERLLATKRTFPALSGMGLYKLTLQPHGFRDPHWHPNADEFGYCLAGEVIVSFYHTGDLKETFLVSAGEAFFIPSGALHYLENVGKKKAELLLAFSHDTPEDFGLASTIGMFSDAVLGNTWGVDQTIFCDLKRPLKDQFAVLRKGSEPIDDKARRATPYRFSLEASEPILDVTGGLVRMARQNVWPILQRQALYSLQLTDRGMREPHWHPETAEMGYVHKGRGRMTIMQPDGKIDTYVLEPGDLYFIPKAYPHHIENLGPGTLHFLIFFDQAMPRDIGFTGSVRSFSNEVLGALLHVEPAFFDRLHKYEKDLFIVDRVNKLD